MEYDFNIDDISRRYLSGETLNHIAESLGCTRNPVIRRLRFAGVPLRSGSEVRINMWRGITSEEDRAHIVSAAHDAVRGKRHSIEHREKRAKTREKRKIGIGRGETILASALRLSGLEVTQQKAIGPYNVDIAIHHGALAVEIFGGNWHSSGSHAARFRKRCDYLLNHGWLPVIIWVTKNFPLERPAVDYLISLSKIASRDKSLRRQERVLRGDGYDSSLKYNPVNGAIKRG